MSDANWSPAMARQDISDQVSDANDAWNDEIWSARNEDWADIYDDRAPTRAEAEADLYANWLWDRNYGKQS